MKIKQHLHIHKPHCFLQGNFDACFVLFGHESPVQEWTYCGEIEINVEIDSGQLIKTVTEAIDKEIEETRADFTERMNILETRKQELLALSYDGAS